MPKNDHQLRRLLKAAASPPPRVSGAVPFALETRVLGQWRSSPAAGPSEFPAGLFRWGVTAAGLVMLVSIALNYRAIETEPPGELAIADYAITMNLTP